MIYAWVNWFQEQEIHGVSISESGKTAEGGTAMIKREDIFAYVKQKYGIHEVYPLSTAPACPVMRHEDSRKWFVVIMDVPGEKLGCTGTEWMDVIDVKLDDPFLVSVLARQDGYYNGYHISRGNWVSITLDGTVPFEEICRWIDESFLTTASKQEKQKYRLPKEWIIPANPKYYDIEHAFDTADEIEWKQGAGIKAGDTVFMYVAAPVSAVLYACSVIETDIPYEFSSEKLTITALMKIKLLRRYRPDVFSFDVLKEKFGIYAVRGPRGVPHSLSEALRNAESIIEGCNV